MTSAAIQQRRQAEFDAATSRVEVDRLIQRWQHEDTELERVESLQATQVKELQARIHALETFFFNASGELSDVFVDLIAMPIAKIRRSIQENEIAELRRQVEDLERTRVKYHGVHEYGVLYPEGSMVTRGGSVWYATKETREAPGEGQTSWTLAVKRGDAK
jgi:alkylhydroperoxidase family enzyme